MNPSVSILLKGHKPARYLREIFIERRSHNGAYSMRAFARDLGVSQALLSLVLNEKRPLTLKQATQISVLLELSASETKDFLEATLLALPKSSKLAAEKLRKRSAKSAKNAFRFLEIERFKLLSQSYHIALLDLTTTTDFRADIGWIASRLGITTMEARDVIDRLLSLGFLEEIDGTYRKAEPKVYFETKRSETAVRSFHRQMMQKAQASMDDTSDLAHQLREISGITMAIAADRIPEAKRRIQQFQREMADFLTEGEAQEVYQLNMQFFPLTKKLKR